MPASVSGKTIASRNATTHGLFARDVVLPALGEDPEGYKLLEAEWMAQLPPRTLLERHYVEKIAAASWRLRRLQRWQAQIYENETLTENERLDRLDKTIRHETALQRQIDTAVKMLNKDAPQLYTRRATDTVLADTRTARREYETSEEDAVHVELKVQDLLLRVREATVQAGQNLADAPLDTVPTLCDTVPVLCEDFDPQYPTLLLSPREVPALLEAREACQICDNELPQDPNGTCDKEPHEICQNELPYVTPEEAALPHVPLSLHPFRLTEYLNPGHRHRPLSAADRRQMAASPLGKACAAKKKTRH